MPGWWSILWLKYNYPEFKNLELSFLITIIKRLSSYIYIFASCQILSLESVTRSKISQIYMAETNTVL